MRINVSDFTSFSQPIVGNVYGISGGSGRKAGHSMVLIAITEKQSALMLVIDKSGEPVGVTSYGLHAIEERAPIAFVPGLDDLTFDMQPIS
ncbi:MAG: hypothetical protein V3W37_08940 [Candidatus Binatia bacterium]